MKTTFVVTLFSVLAFFGVSSCVTGMFAPSLFWKFAAVFPALPTGWLFTGYAVNRLVSRRRSALYGEPSTWLQWALFLPFAAIPVYLFFLFTVGSYLTIEFGQSHVRMGQISNSYYSSGRRRVDCLKISASIEREADTIYFRQCLPETYGLTTFTGFSYFSTSESKLGVFALPSRRSRRDVP